MAAIRSSPTRMPRIAIEFCTQCKWNLRAAYYAQELLQTFSTSVGEVALIPATGGVFTITVTHTVVVDPKAVSGNIDGKGDDVESHIFMTNVVIWDRKSDGGFPETKELKSRLRNIIEPGRDLGHIDRSLKKQNDGEEAKLPQAKNSEATPDPGTTNEKQALESCEDCK